MTLFKRYTELLAVLLLNKNYGITVVIIWSHTTNVCMRGYRMMQASWTKLYECIDREALILDFFFNFATGQPTFNTLTSAYHIFYTTFRTKCSETTKLRFWNIFAALKFCVIGCNSLMRWVSPSFHQVGLCVCVCVCAPVCVLCMRFCENRNIKQFAYTFEKAIYKTLVVFKFLQVPSLFNFVPKCRWLTWL